MLVAAGFDAELQRRLPDPESVAVQPEAALHTPSPIPVSDTVYGPEVFDIPSGDSALHVEDLDIEVTVGVMYYEVEIKNGAGGSNEVDQARIEINGIELVSSEEELPSTSVKIFGLAEENDLIVELWGEEGSFVTITVRHSFPAYTILAESEINRQSTGPASEDSLDFEIPADVIPPFGLIFSTGSNADSAWIELNGVEVAGPDDFIGATEDGLVQIDLADSVNTLEVRLASPTPGYLDVHVVGIVHDTIPPEIEITSPAPGFVTGEDSVTVQGIVRDAWHNLYVYFSAPPPQWEIEDSTFTATVELPSEGTNLLYPTAYDIGGNTADTIVTVIRDTSAPALIVTAPQDGSVIGQDSVTVTGSVTDATAVTVDANGVPLPVDGAGQFTGGISLSEGANFVTVAATDEAENSSQVVRVVTVDTEAPEISVTSPTDQSTTSADSVDVTGTVTDATDVTLTLNSISVPVDSLGAFDTRIGLVEGVNTLAFLATDEADNQTADTVTVTRSGGGLPPDPSTVASEIEPNVASLIGAVTAFLYEGPDSIQTGVAPGTIDPVRVAVVKGAVVDRDGDPVPGVTVSVLDHPEFGQTLTRADGAYDMAVNGGGIANVRFQLDGYPEVQRRVVLPWQDYLVLDSIAMTPLDTAVTVIDFSDPIEIAQGTPQTDADGTRQATLMFRQGTVAMMVLPNGAVDTLSSISVRATEYTVGDDGQAAMPAGLPLTNVYTYAVELSVDEAIAAGAERVEFDQPVPLYVENFLEMPVGADVPIGYFDRAQGEWKGEPDGRIIEVVDIDSLGVASLNIDTIAGAEDPDTVLAYLGIDADELGAIGSVYSIGDELWRGEVTHFSPHDYNFSAFFLDFIADVWEFLEDPHVPDWLLPEECTTCKGSIINVEGQYLDERIAVTGTPFTLNYSSLRVPGRQASYRLDIPVISDSIPAQLERATLDVFVAGRRWHQNFAADSSVTYQFVWDGMDAYGRLLFGQQPIRTLITYYFDVPMLATVSTNRGSRFGLPAGAGGIQAGSAREEAGFQVEWNGRIGARALDRSMAGWSLDLHHSYDPIAGRLYLGDGRNRFAPATLNVVGTIAGIGSVNFDGEAGEGELATKSPVSQPMDVAVTAAGNVSILSLTHGWVRQIADNDTINTIVGSGSSYPDSVPADSAGLPGPRALSYGPDGSLWIGSSTSSAANIHRIWPDGIIETFGSPTAVGLAGDGGPVRADSVRFKYIQDLAVGPDGAVYFIHGDNTSINCLGAVCRKVRRIGPEGMLSTIAGTGGEGGGGDDGPAIAATFNSPGAIAIGPDGSVYVGDKDAIRRITPDGIISRFAGFPHGVGFGDDYDGDGGPALSARIYVSARGLVVGSDGSVYFSQVGGAVRHIDPQGIIRTIAGTGEEGYSGDGGRALAAQFDAPAGLAIAPDGALIIADVDDHRVRRLGPALPGFDPGGYLIASEDASVVYQFGLAGQHLQTLSAVTGATLYAFEYDGDNRLVGITDGDGLETTIERDQAGDPESITGPFGQETGLTVDLNGYLATVTNPASETHSFATDTLGLLEEFITPRQDTTRMEYDDDGFLELHTDPAGRVTTLTRSVGDDFLQVEMVRGSRASTYRVEELADGSVRRLVTDPAGNESETIEGLDGVTVASTPDSTTRSSTEGPDPRFRIESPVTTQATLDLPSGLTSVLVGGRRVELTDTLDPLSLVSVLDTVVLNGRTYRSSYDRATRTLTSTTPEGRETVSVLDSLERLVSHEVAGLDSVAFTYDGSGLLTAAAQGARSWTFDYDASGRLQAATDPLNRTDSLFYDLADRVTRQVLADGDSIAYGYDANGNLTSLTPPGRPAHTFSYNAAGLDSIYDPPDVTGLGEDRTFYSYDTNRELIEILRPDSGLIAFAYDSAGRVDSVAIPRGTLDYAYSDSTGQLISITAPGSEGLAFEYDGVLPTLETWTGTVSGAVGFAYDADLRLSGLAVNGDTVAYGHDSDGLLTAAGDLMLVRDSLNGLLSETELDNVTTRTRYNAFGEPAADSAWVSAELVFARTYSRDNLGRISEVVDYADSVTTIWGYGYDDVGRLETVTQDSVAYASYTYDANGNRLTRTSGAGTETGTYDNQDRLLTYDGATYAYTPAGELQLRIEGADTTRFEYDALGNLIEVELPDGTLVEYVIDGRNRRVGRRVDGELVQAWLYGDQLHPVAELDSLGNVVSRFVYGAKANVPDYIIAGGDTLRVVSDHLGSVRLVLNASTGAVSQRISYDAWGRVLEDTNPGFQPFGFAGGISDPLTGLVRFGARDYDVVAGRWTAKDPVGVLGGTNVLAYAGNDPVNYVDPLGLWPDWIDALGRWFGELLTGRAMRRQIDRYRPQIHMASDDFGVDPALVCAIALKERMHLSPPLVEPMLERMGLGSTVGIGQINPNIHGFDRAELFDPATNFRAMAEILSRLQSEGLIDPSRPVASLATRYNNGGASQISTYGDIVETLWAEYAWQFPGHR